MGQAAEVDAPPRSIFVVQKLNEAQHITILRDSLQLPKSSKSLGLLRLAAEERRHIQIVRWNFVAHLADVLLHLMNNV